MRKLLVAMTAFAALSAAAQAGLVCTSAPELKVLQSTALQQQLMVAALTCHMREDYGRFVVAYRDGLMQSDAALKAFFAARPRGEDYHAYKTRIANAASLHSVRDPRFCDSARKVFDMALGRSAERRGLAPEPPQLVETGYEGCRPVDNRLIEAKAQPAAKVAAIPKPAPRPASVPVKLAAAPTVRLLAAAPVPTAKPAIRVEVLHPHVAIAVLKPAPVAPVPSKPVQVAVAKTPVAAKPVLAPKPAMPVMAAKPAAIAPAVTPKMAEARPSQIASALPKPAVSPKLPPVASDRPRWRADDSTPSADQDPSLSERETAVAEPSRRSARQEWRRPEVVDPDDPYADNHVPNAYRPGAEWVSDGGAWRSARYDRPPPPRGYWVLGRDGRWVLVVPRASRWRY